MRIKMLTLYAGPLGTFQPGTSIEVSDEEGKQLVNGNYAIPDAPVPVVEVSESPSKPETPENPGAFGKKSKGKSTVGG